jgi:hypothetical protein
MCIWLYCCLHSTQCGWYCHKLMSCPRFEAGMCNPVDHNHVVTPGQQHWIQVIWADNLLLQANLVLLHILLFIEILVFASILVLPGILVLDPWSVLDIGDNVSNGISWIPLNFWAIVIPCVVNPWPVSCTKEGTSLAYVTYPHEWRIRVTCIKTYATKKSIQAKRCDRCSKQNEWLQVYVCVSVVCAKETTQTKSIMTGKSDH